MFTRQVGGVTQRCRLLLTTEGGWVGQLVGFFPRGCNYSLDRWVFESSAGLLVGEFGNFLVGANLLGGDFVG